MPRLNRDVELEVTAYGYPGGTAAGDAAAGGRRMEGQAARRRQLQPRLTRYALLKAGLPDTVRLNGPNGPKSAS